MKNKAKKMLDNKTTNVEADAPMDEEDEQICAFCQETLHSNDYLTEPFGKFFHAQASKLLCHSVE